MVWRAKENPQSTSYSFDATPHFQYFNAWTKTDIYKEQLKTGLTESMSVQGSCFMLTREKYWELNICDEEFGNWGNQGIEVACKTWLTGGRVLVNHNTWYAHLFRTNATLHFPWPTSGIEQQITKAKVVNYIWNKDWPRPLSWLLKKFWPVNGWTEKQLDMLK